MKRVLYTMPAVMVVLFYGMLALLAGGFASFQPRAWLMPGASSLTSDQGPRLAAAFSGVSSFQTVESTFCTSPQPP